MKTYERDVVEQCTDCGVLLDDRAQNESGQDDWCDDCGEPMCSRCSRDHDRLCDNCHNDTYSEEE